VNERVEPISAGRHGLSAEQVRASRSSRLTAAMVEAVAIHGYPGTTIARLVALARISKSDFYGVFSSKEECFWATFEECLERFAAKLAASVDGVQEGRPRLAAAIGALAVTIDSEPAAVSLVLVDSLALGPAADDPRARSQERFESMLRSGAAAAGGPAMTPARARGVVIGLRRLAYQAIRDTDSSRLRRGTRDLVDWIIDCATAPPAHELADDPETVPGSSTEIPWDAPPADWTSRVGLSPRERIMRACVQLMVEDGYEKLSIPRIVGRAATSNQTFYEEFGGKEDAVLAAFDAAVEPVLLAAEASLAATGGDAEASIAAMLGELRAYLSAEPLLAELCFRAMPRVGRPGLERLDLVMSRIATLLARACPGRRSARRELRTQAAAGGLWGLMRAAAMDDGGTSDVPFADLVDFAAIACAARAARP
jgi:AcrR family transcriptional regulator